MSRPIRSASKYHAQPCEVNGITFHSTKEARRFQELSLLVLAGEIYNLELQPVYPLNVMLHGAGQAKTIGKYVADFQYRSVRGPLIVEDVKGYDTPLSKWKRRHVLAQYGIEVLIT